MRSAIDALTWANERTTYPMLGGVTQCMRFVLQAYDLIPIAGYGSAVDGWNLAQNRQPGNQNLLPGQPAYFFGRYGHVVIGTGNGDQVRSTSLTSTDVYTTTIAELRAGGIVGAYLGSVTDFSGRPIDFTTTAGGGGTRPIIEEEEDTMSKMFVVADGKTPYVVVTPNGKIVCDDGKGNRVDPSALAIIRNLYSVPTGSDQVVAKSTYDYLMAKIPTAD